MTFNEFERDILWLMRCELIRHDALKSVIETGRHGEHTVRAIMNTSCAASDPKEALSEVECSIRKLKSKAVAELKKIDNPYAFLFTPEYIHRQARYKGDSMGYTNRICSENTGVCRVTLDIAEHFAMCNVLDFLS